MTEAEWLVCTDPKRMLAFRQGRALWRKRLLYGCACCRLIWQLLTDQDSRQAVAVCERHADGLVTEDELMASRAAARAAEQRAGEARKARWDAGGTRTSGVDPEYHLAYVLSLAADAPSWLLGYLTRPRFSPRGYDTLESTVARAALAWCLMAWQSPTARQAATWWMRATRADLLRDIFGNPFQPVPRPAAWRTPDVLLLAQVAYEERCLPSGHLDFARLCVLADALEEAGCTDAAILDHLRSPVRHVRGCWGLDLLLGKK
jgi:hypothetical protein